MVFHHILVLPKHYCTINPKTFLTVKSILLLERYLKKKKKSKKALQFTPDTYKDRNKKLRYHIMKQTCRSGKLFMENTLVMLLENLPKLCQMPLKNESNVM